MTPTNINNIDNNIDNNDNNYINNNNDKYKILLTYIDLFVTPLKRLIANLKNNIKNLREEIVKKDQLIEELSNECCLCLMDKSQYIFIPCGHFCMCNTCTAQYKDHDFNFCPVCKRNGETFRVY